MPPKRFFSKSREEHRLSSRRSRKGPKEAHPLRRDATPTGVEKYKTAGNKQPTIATTLNPEPSVPKAHSGADPSQRPHPPAFKTGIRDAAIRPISAAETRPSSPERRDTRAGRERPGAPLPGTYAAQPNAKTQPGSFPQLGESNPGLSQDESEVKAGLPQQETGGNSGVLQQGVEKAVLEALRGAEERCDRAVAAAEARSKQALAQAELDRERAVRVATMDLEARLRKEFAAEKRAIAEAAVRDPWTCLSLSYNFFGGLTGVGFVRQDHAIDAYSGFWSQLMWIHPRRE